jgi:hypothetical protein
MSGWMDGQGKGDGCGRREEEGKAEWIGRRDGSRVSREY